MSSLFLYQDKDKRMNILDIISRSLLHPLDAEEQKQLDLWLAEGEEHRKLYRLLLEKQDLVEQYQTYMKLDENKAWGLFKAKTNQSERKSKLRYLLYPYRKSVGWVAAAIVGVLLLMGGYQLYVAHPTQKALVPMSQEMMVAMRQSEQSKTNQATLQVGTSKPRQVRSLSALLKATAQDGVDDHLQGTLTTRHDKEFWMSLPDGTRVHLNGNSRISYPLAFKGDLREVALVGEAYFVVARDEAHPFVVHTANGEIKEYGTEFNVNTYGEKTSVVLVKGSISVKPKGGSEQLMTPGDKADMGIGGITKSKVDVTPYIAWNTGHFSFEDCTLDELMLVVGRWYGKQVVFTSESLRTVRFTGSLSRYESMESTLEVIATLANVKMEQQENKILISKI